MVHELRSFFHDDDLHGGLEEMNRITRIGLEPELAVLHEEAHDHLEENQIIILDDLDKWVHDLRKVVDLSKDRTPIGQRAENSNKFVEVVSAFYWESFIKVFKVGVNAFL